jgi:5-(carboxyamino)imidazole ribonucleotide mutase
MPNGIPVATVALNGAKNAGILAARILGINDGQIAQNLVNFANKMEREVAESQSKLH